MTVIIKLDREREIRYNVRASIEAEAVMSMPFHKILETEGFTPIRALLWAGLRHEDRRLSLDQVEKFLDDAIAAGRLDEIKQVIWNALVEAKYLTPPEDDQNPNPEG